MSKQALSPQLHMLRALNLWPKDTLRPQIQLQDVLRKRLEKESDSSESQLKQANALYSILNDRYKKHYPIAGNETILKPRSHPTYFADLIRELEEAPSRSWLQRMMLRIKGAVRLE